MRLSVPVAIGLILLSPLAAALAIPITSINQLVVFGDSLSDPGNVSIATTGAFPGSNYAVRNVAGVPFTVNYYTDGPSTTPATAGPTGLWIDQLAPKLGVSDPQPFLAPSGGNSYAVGFAETGSSITMPFYVTNQIGYFNAAHPGGAPSTALYTIWAGANDIFDGKNPVTAADNLYASILTLSGEGAKYFLWPNLPPLGNTPFGYANNLVASLDALTAAFNSEWAIDLAKLQGQGIQVVGVDVNALFDQVVANPAFYGFTDVTDSAQGVSGINPNTYLFWDDVHPTTAADALIANLAFNDFVATPEPESIALALIGIGATLLIAKNRRHRRSVRHFSIRHDEHLTSV